MFGEFPNLFGKNFAIGYFLPITLFFASNFVLTGAFGILTAPAQLAQVDLLVGTTLITLLLWLCSILLVVFNRQIYRFYEGYGALNPFRVFKTLEKRRYTRLVSKLDALDAELDTKYEEYPNRPAELPISLTLKHAKVLLELAEKYPDNEAYLLSTAFGNILRSFERYPQVMYGIEAITGWSRLQAVISKEFQELTDTAKAQTDFWINLLFLSMVLYIEYIVFVLAKDVMNYFWIPFGLTFVMVVAFSGANNAALEWGDYVKASFDLYLPKLQEQLNYPTPETRDEEVQFWSDFSRAITFRDPEDLRDRRKRAPLYKANKYGEDKE